LNISCNGFNSDPPLTGGHLLFKFAIFQKKIPVSITDTGIFFEL